MNDGSEGIPFTLVERAMARRMQAAVDVPLSHQYVYVDVERALDLVGQLRKAGRQVTFNALMIAAVANVLSADPAVAAVVNYDAFERRLPDPINIGVAVTTERGLVVPVVKEASRLDFADLVKVTNDVVEAARSGSTDRDLYLGGHFTVTNLGKHGVDGGIPIPAIPQIAILGISSARQTPVVKDGEIAIGLVARFGVSLDHRALDGVTVARFLRSLRDIVERPPREWSP